MSIYRSILPAQLKTILHLQNCSHILHNEIATDVAREIVDISTGVWQTLLCRTVICHLIPVRKQHTIDFSFLFGSWRNVRFLGAVASSFRSFISRNTYFVSVNSYSGGDGLDMGEGKDLGHVF